MIRYLKIFILSLILLAVVLFMIFVPFVVLFYIYSVTEDYPLIVRAPVLVLGGAFLLIMGWGGLIKRVRKTSLFKKKRDDKSKLP